MPILNENYLTLIIILISLWTIPWKGWALWIAARNKSKIWFIILLILNTIAILDILYIFVFSKRKKNETVEVVRNNKIEEIKRVKKIVNQL